MGISKLFKKKKSIIKEIPEHLRRRLQIISHLKIDTLLDIGANSGHYAIEIRRLGYNGKLISFEPLKQAFIELQENASRDENWATQNYALGNENTTMTINVAGNSLSSSMLDMLDSHADSAPYSKYVGEETIEVKTLDSVYDQFAQDNNNVMCKIDTQGYEKHVLEGASNVLDRVRLLQLEMSIIPLYASELIYTEMIAYLDNLGFSLISLENGFSDPDTGQLLQADGIFVRKDFIEKNKLR